MERYLQQLLDDIAFATENIDLPYCENRGDIWAWISDDEEDRTAPRRPLEEWTGIRKVALPPVEKLTDDQVHRLLGALKHMLDEYNWSFVMQIKVPERLQYAALRANYDQEAIVKQWHMGFFQICREGGPHANCVLGAYCHCRLFQELFSNFVDEDLTPEEERARALEIEVAHIKRKYGDAWMKYYPYHLDPEYDDKDGNPYDYGFGIHDDDDPADAWKK